MSIEDKKIVDFISNDKDGNVVLSISDHLEWDEKNEHLLLLQEKINDYLNFIETDQINKEIYNTEKGKIIIHLYCKYFPNADGVRFLDMTKEILNNAGYKFQFTEVKDQKN